MATRINNDDRDAEICRLWQDDWRVTEIAERLDISEPTIYNVVRKHDLVRKPRGKAQTFTSDNAPIEAWQQVLLPRLHRAADENDLDGIQRRLFILLALLNNKPYSALSDFAAWACEVTGYDADEVALFLDRAKQNHILGADDQPDPLAFKALEEEHSDIAVFFLILTLGGFFIRSADAKYSLAPEYMPAA